MHQTSSEASLDAEGTSFCFKQKVGCLLRLGGGFIDFYAGRETAATGGGILHDVQNPNCMERSGMQGGRFELPKT